MDGSGVARNVMEKLPSDPVLVSPRATMPSDSGRLHQHQYGMRAFRSTRQTTFAPSIGASV
ncbi:MAG: hypothetical protein BWY82_01727 [Verrucomicrobia bacterium ADurb.Bin474]|nr:MAG: hypothetical protein BWY82_01727 [Verrucomicrobia bacterium ADurb.Bin474]